MEPLKKNSYISEKWNPLAQRVKTFIYFLKKIFLIFQEIKFFYILENGTFRTRKIKQTPLLKSFSFFWKCNFLAPSLKISGENLLKIKNFTISQLFKHKHKVKKFLLYLPS